MSTAKLFLLLGSVNAFLAVLLGAFGAHALRARVEGRLFEVFETGSEYHFYHALGLLLIGLLARSYPESRLIFASGALMMLGILVFSGSLYGLAVTGARWLGAITPIGGTAFLIAWVLLAIAVLRGE
jgi:uncharacterized membrane protein YgdD (TMEM256/DUF423 family)